MIRLDNKIANMFLVASVCNNVRVEVRDSIEDAAADRAGMWFASGPWLEWPRGFIGLLWRGCWTAFVRFDGSVSRRRWRRTERTLVVVPSEISALVI